MTDRSHWGGRNPRDPSGNAAAARSRAIDKARREVIATACLQGLLSDGCPHFPDEEDVGNTARAAVAYTDALISELNKEDA